MKVHHCLLIERYEVQINNQDIHARRENKQFYKALNSQLESQENVTTKL